jgi:pSer/pThr/pTyr-binding forkhead associated (FHA) protein
LTGDSFDHRGWPAPYPPDAEPLDSMAAATSDGVPTAEMLQFSSSAPDSEGELQVINGSCSGQRIRMAFHRLVVGAARDCDLRPSPLLSRHHCVFKKDEYAVRVRDLGSNSGTFVNGRRITSEVVLNPGDEVTVGDVKLSVVLPRAPDVIRAADSNPSISDFVIL